MKTAQGPVLYSGGLCHAFFLRYTAYMTLSMDQQKRDFLARMAVRYVWWKSPDEALAAPERVILQVMDIGDHEDEQALRKLLGDEQLCDVLRWTQAGQLRPRSWHYWHYCLGLASAPAEIPRMPVRAFE